jgi:hypothetical protein
MTTKASFQSGQFFITSETCQQAFVAFESWRLVEAEYPRPTQASPWTE